MEDRQQDQEDQTPCNDYEHVWHLDITFSFDAPYNPFCSSRAFDPSALEDLLRGKHLTYRSADRIRWQLSRSAFPQFFSNVSASTSQAPTRTSSPPPLALHCCLSLVPYSIYLSISLHTRMNDPRARDRHHGYQVEEEEEEERKAWAWRARGVDQGRGRGKGSDREARTHWGVGEGEGAPEQ